MDADPLDAATQPSWQMKANENMIHTDRPAWPPGSEILAQAFDAYANWQNRWSEDLEEIEDYEEMVLVYSYMLDGIDIDLAKAMAKADRASR